MSEPASTHRRCRHCGVLQHRDRFARHHAVCRACNIANGVVNRRARRRADPAVRAKELAWERRRRARERAARQAEVRWRRDWAHRTLRRLHAAGWSYRAIADGAGVHRQTIFRWKDGIGTHIKQQAFERLWDWARGVEERPHG